jgi:hypothetical protein
MPSLAPGLLARQSAAGLSVALIRVLGKKLVYSTSVLAFAYTSSFFRETRSRAKGVGWGIKYGVATGSRTLAQMYEISRILP